nr:hypothetical protein [Tanacetum cinerariifolium]
GFDREGAGCGRVLARAVVGGRAGIVVGSLRVGAAALGAHLRRSNYNQQQEREEFGQHPKKGKRGVVTA